MPGKALSFRDISGLAFAGGGDCPTALAMTRLEDAGAAPPGAGKKEGTDRAVPLVRWLFNQGAFEIPYLNDVIRALKSTRAS